ncbi:MAG: UDP-N-acetylmuramoyl-tripeptide--D-alanyl-D-alanine ligase [Bacteroidetes bacterium]|nr:MAG: UDP-N-acetylmuramoyl-tripeptide--D-alanyl-D-alanine ligase [Bacteroidota bacterium]
MIQKIYEFYLKSRSVSTDSRKIKAGDVFFALKGDNFNGNQFAKNALALGASCAVVDEAEFAVSEQYILVENVLKALQDLAILHRKNLNIPVVGITGSNGKTTCKELTAAVLSEKYQIYATKGNLNNHIGVPLSILAIPENAQMAVIEMGANKVGDIAELCQIAQPTHGFITSIGDAHLEGFGGIEGVIRGKTELYDFLKKTNGTVFIQSDHPILANMQKRFDKEKVVLYAENDNFLNIKLNQATPFVSYWQNETQISTNLTGKHHLNNILAALAVANFFDVPNDLANQAISNYLPENNRSQIIEKGNNTIFLDAYNANPTSMSAALENFEQIEAKNKIAIIGDMFELGIYALDKHREIIDLALELKLDQIILCGLNFAKAKTDRDSILHFNDKQELADWLKINPIQNSHILLKASRGIALETLLEYL